jgi:hypothetical protein
MRVPSPALPFLLVLGLAACGGAEPAATTAVVSATAAPAVTSAPAASAAAAAPATTGAAPAVGAAPAAAANVAAPVAYSAMTKEQQLQHMKTVIRPTMGKVFTAFDGKKYGDFGCATCHGEKKEDPHQALPKLTLSGDGFKKLFAEKPAMMKFMTEQVTPTMATAMGEKPFDPATHQGFGCGGCHTVK